MPASSPQSTGKIGRLQARLLRDGGGFRGAFLSLPPRTSQTEPTQETDPHYPPRIQSSRSATTAHPAQHSRTPGEPPAPFDGQNKKNNNVLTEVDRRAAGARGPLVDGLAVVEVGGVARRRLEERPPRAQPHRAAHLRLGACGVARARRPAPLPRKRRLHTRRTRRAATNSSAVAPDAGG
jgi:hypothetical protein